MPLSFTTRPPKTSTSLRCRRLRTAWGPIALVGRDQAICRLIWAGPNGDITKTIAALTPAPRPDRQLLPDLTHALQSYFTGSKPAFHCTLDISWATDFARSVLRACCRIPLGQTATYGQLARLVGRPGAARAVGTIMANNPLPLLIPCHRIVPAHRYPGNYSLPGGTDLKRRLLNHEAALI